MRHRLVVTYSSEIVTHHLSASFQPSSLTLIYKHPFDLVFPPCLHHQFSKIDHCLYQELVYERPYMVLPPLVEWLRVATVFTETRFSTNVEKDDVFQVSRLGLKSGILW